MATMIVSRTVRLAEPLTQPYAEKLLQAIKGYEGFDSISRRGNRLSVRYDPCLLDYPAILAILEDLDCRPSTGLFMQLKNRLYTCMDHNMRDHAATPFGLESELQKVYLYCYTMEQQQPPSRYFRS
jgi:hypothetical protein